MRRIALGAALAVAAFAVVLGAENALVAALFPRLPRVTTDFSAAYLAREMRALAADPRPTVFLGDSVLWGYGLQPPQTAVALLRARGCVCRNLAFKNAGPAAYRALALLMRADGVQPGRVVIEINQRVLNPADAAYHTLVPAVAALAQPLLPAAERAELTPAPHEGGVRARLESALAAAWLPYAMRTDIRQTLLGEDAPPAAPAAAGAYEGTYDLTPLDEHNDGVRALAATVDVLRGAGAAVVAFTTPTNHRLLHAYIDAPEYRTNDRYLVRLLERHGARVLDLDGAFPAAEFIDNDHLDAAGQRRLAQLLSSSVAHGRSAMFRRTVRRIRHAAQLAGGSFPVTLSVSPAGT